jgi:DNA-binding GntR family transcriptional regulator
MEPKIERNDPPYMQVVAQIRQRITDGQIAVGDAIPSAREITREWGVSLATATKVLAALRSEGLVKAVVGIGTVVVRPLPAFVGIGDSGTSEPSPAGTESPQDHLRSMRETGRIYAPGNYAKIVAAELVPAPTHVAEALGVEEGALVIRRHRVTYRDDKPSSASTSWFDGALADVAPRLLTTERMPQGTPGYICEATGRVAHSGRDLVTARIATTDDAAELGVEPGTVILQGENWFLDEDGAVIEFGEYITADGRSWSYNYRSPR